MYSSLTLNDEYDYLLSAITRCCGDGFGTSIIGTKIECKLFYALTFISQGENGRDFWVFGNSRGRRDVLRGAYPESATQYAPEEPDFSYIGRLRLQ